MKRILALLLAFTLLVTGMCLFTSCKDDSDDTNDSGNNDNGGDDTVKVDYTVKVVDQDGNGVANVPVELKVGPTKTAKYYDITTDANGVATQKMEETNLPIVAYLGTLPEGYGTGASGDEVDFESGAKSATFTVVKQVKYSAKLVDADNNAISGIAVQVCVGESCLNGKNTDANGEAYFYINPTEETVKLQINYLTDKEPVDFSYDSNTQAYYAYYESGEYTMTVTLVAK